MYRITGQYTKPLCRDGNKHTVEWNYNHLDFESDLLHVYGECVFCHLEFEKTYQQTEGLTVVAKSSRNAFDFNHEVHELN